MGRAGAGRAAHGGPWFPTLEELDGEELQRFGLILDRRPMSLGGQTVAMVLAEKMLQVRTREGRTEALIANPMQKLFEERRGQRNIVLKARQMGFTTWAAARFFLKTIMQPGTLTLEVAHTQEAAEEIFRIVHRFLDCLPEALRGGPLKTSRSSVRALSFPELDAQYLVVSAAKRNAGRGLTLQNLHCSEVARWPGDAAETLAGLRAALAPQGEMILESTPDGIGGCFYEEWMKATETGVVQHFFPWWKEPGYRALAVTAESLTAEERALRKKCGLDLAQIGYRRGIRANFRGRVEQEYAENWVSCFRATGDPVFELRAVEERLQSARGAVTTRRNGELEIWLPPQPGKKYVVAVDPAEGGCEGDYSAAQVVELEMGLQCAEFAGHVGGTELARLVTELANEYNQGWLVVERNGPGSGVLVALEEVCHYARIFRKDGKAGWTTTSMSRPLMLGKLDAALVEAPQCFFSAKLLVECRSFVRMRNGSTGARAGTHDDRVMAMALALAARAEILTSHR
ncbi:MAG TPA: terminase [Acidobacteriaceae bacterium]